MIEPLRTIGVLAALPAELGALRGAGEAAAGPVGVRIAAHGPLVARGPLVAGASADGGGGGAAALTAVSGVGKVRAAHAAAALLASGAQAIVVVGTAGALDPAREVGDLVLATEAIQWDLAGRDGRRIAADPGLLEAWRAAAPGAALAPFLTSDRPALGPLQRAARLRAARRSLGRGAAPVAEMETAAVAQVCARAGVPWAALRVVSDRPLRLHEVLRRERRARGSFVENFERVAGAPAATLGALFARLANRTPPTELDGLAGGESRGAS